MRDFLPRKNLRLKKKAFYMPLSGCFFDKYQEFIRENMNSTNVQLVERGIFDKVSLSRFVQQNLDKRDLLTTKKLFALATLELWMKNL